MNITDFINNNGEYQIGNPNYNPRSNKNAQPATIKSLDVSGRIDPFSRLAAIDAEKRWSATEDQTKKYNLAGYTYNPYEVVNMDKQLAEAQNASEKFLNAAKQTFWSEFVLGTIKSFADLADIITGAAFRSDGDFSNPVSRYLEEAQENFRNNNPIFVDPTKNIVNGGLTDAGWWASNIPSIASSLTLLIPSKAAIKGASLLTQVGKVTSYTRKALTGAKNIEKIEDIAKLGRVGSWANKESTITAANKMVENGLTAAVMRTMENYQEARQVYNDMYNEASTSLRNMSDEEYADFLNKNAEEISKYGVNENNRDEVAKAIAHNAANKTFAIDYSNMIFDVAQIYALRNPLKLSKNMRATSATRKAERIARRNAGKSAEEIAKLDASETFKQKIKNFAYDHAADGKIIAAEASEGIEESINYIATEEGMHYGRLMIDPENNPDLPFSNRLGSYLASPELYDAAFWGIMGGVMFQEGGSFINRGYNVAEGSIRDKLNKKKNDKTKEDKPVGWKERFETAENKRRVAEINSREQAYNTFAERLTQIEEDKDPFNKDPNDPTKQATISSDMEKDIARKRAIDEYIVGMTFRAIENGNYDMLKAYLRDENVRKALAEKGVIDESSSDTDVEQLIQRMDEVEQIYNDNLIAIDGISQAFNDIPFEYVQIIAKDNALAQIQLQRLDTKLGAYETSADKNNRRFGANLEEGIDYKSAVQLVVTARKLGMLRARKKTILNDKEFAQSLDGQNAINDINREIELINKNLYSDEWNQSDKPSSFGNKLARLLWANGLSTKGYYDEQGVYRHNNNDESYRQFLEDVASRNMDALRELTNVDFKASDEDIIGLFGEGEQSTGSYDVLSQDLNAAFNVEKGLDKIAPNLDSDYQNIAAIKLAKLTQQAKIANTTKSINARINELHNSMNEARKKAINESNKTIFDLGKKYGSAKIADYIFSNEDIEDIDASDKKKLKDALEVLNLTSDSNRTLAENLRWSLIIAEANAETTEAVTSEENATNKQENTASQNSQSTNSTQTVSESPSEQNTQQNEQISTESPAVETQKQKVIVSPNIDGGIDVNTNVGANDTSYTYTETAEGDMILSYPDNRNVPDNWISNSTMYDGYDRNAAGKPVVESFPVIGRDANDNYFIKQKGKVVYEEEVKIEAKPEATNPSTGERVEPQQPRQEVASKEEPVAQISATDEEIENIENSIQDEANNLFRNRDKEKDSNIVETIDDITNKLLEQHKNDENQEVVKRAIARANKILKARATRRGLIKSAAEVLSSSVTEMSNGKYDFSEEYKRAVVKMIEDYCRENGIREINGKRYINLEDTLRRINTLFEDKAIANMMFGAINAYLNTTDAKNKFVVMDNTTNVEEFLNNVKKTSEQRIIEKIGERDDKTHRVSIDRYFENASQEFLKKFDSINKGDKLGIKFDGTDIVLTKDGVAIGTLPKPLIDEKTGCYYKYNKGWRTDVGKDGNKIISTLRDIFGEILINNEGINGEINDAITELNYGKVSEERKKELVNLIYDKINGEYKVVEKGILSSSTSREEAVEYLQSLWKYYDTRTDSPNERNRAVSRSLNLWFEKLYDEYNSIDRFKDYLRDPNSEFEVVVEKITSGEIIRIIDSDNLDDRNNYDKFVQSNEALANPDEVQFGVVNPNNGHQLLTSTGKVIEHDNLSQPGAPTIIIPNKNGMDNYIVGTSIRFNDNNLTGDARQIINAIKKEINYQIDKHIKEGNYQGLFDIFKDLFYNSNNGGQVIHLGTNTALFKGIVFTKAQDNSQGFSIFVGRKDKLGAGISIHNNSSKTFNIKRNGESSFSDENRNKSFNNEEDVKLFKEILEDIYNAASMNIAMNYLNSDITGRGTNGLATKTNNGKFVISIPNSEDPSKPVIKIYDSFRDAVIKGGLIKVNTKIENGSNYRRKGKNQAANQILEVSLTRKTTSPVKESVTTPISLASNAEKVLTDDSVTDKASALVGSVLTDEQLKNLNELHLLPEHIIFDESLNTQDADGNWRGANALAKLKTGKTVVGRRWLDMFNEEGEFAGSIPGEQKLQAIRKLIHEQLHHKLNQRGRQEYLRKIEEIYNEFRESLNNASDESKQRINKYKLPLSVVETLKENDYYKNIIEKLSEDEIIDYIFNSPNLSAFKDVILEEFLVESLTSGELVDYLNSVKAEVEKKKLSNNLWQRILKLLSDIFGWKVEKGSLREKELYALQSQIKNIQKGLENISKTETETNVEVKEEQIVKEEEKIEDTDTEQDVTDSDQELTDDDIFAAFSEINNNDIDTRGSMVTENINNYTPEMEEIKAKAIADGTFMKAPKGQPTNLNERQWLQVRTANFINWFGDWINHPEQASKVVDENGEPLVVYHGTPNVWNIYNASLFASNTDEGYYGKGLYLSSVENKAKQYGKTMALFVNIRKPLRTGIDKHITMKEAVKNVAIAKDFNRNGDLSQYDGVLYSGTEGMYEEIVVPTSNQIKSATFNNGEFSTTNDDIRYSSVTEAPTKHSSILEFANTLPIDKQAEFLASVNAGEIQTRCQ